MPAKAPLTSIECVLLSHLSEELASVQDALSCTETEENWDSIATALSRFAALCNGNANTYPAELVLALRNSSRPIASALNSERTRLSGTATDFLTTAATALGHAFDPLVPHYLPTLFILCTRTNKVVINRAKTCIGALVEHTQALSIIHYCALSVTDKSVSLRLAAAETLLLCLNGFNPPDLEKEQRAKEIEGTIRTTAVDASADVRKVGRKLFDAYKILFPGRVQSFTGPMSPKTRKYLDINATAAVPRSQPPSRTTSSQSVRSTSSDTRPGIVASSSHPSSSTTTIAAAAQRPSKHVRSTSTSRTTFHAPAQPAPTQPTRPPTPEAARAPAPALPREGPRRPMREEPRRLKVDMPPPDYIPSRPADTGPQRPMSATELHFNLPRTTSSERPVSGPQRVIREATPSSGAGAVGTTSAARAGPIRPAAFALPDAVGAGAEKKERVVGGARRVLRMPEAAEHAGANAEGKGRAASGPIRPRVISTSKSSPAVPLRTASASAKEKEEAARVKKLASSMGASSRGGAGAGTSIAAAASVVPSRVSRTASVATLMQGTAGSRARAAEKTHDKEKSKDKPKEKEERAQPKVSSRAVAAPAPRPGGAITTRDRASRVPSSKSGKAETQASATDPKVQKLTAKSRSPSEAPEAPAIDIMSPAEVPLPESPKAAPLPERGTSPPPLICLDAPENSQHDDPAPKTKPDTASIPVPPPAQELASIPAPAPADIPLPPSQPSSDGELTPPPTAAATPPAISIDTSALLHAPTTPEQQPHRRAAEVAQTPISALVASIQRGFFAMHGGAPLSPMREEDESVLVADGDSEGGGRVTAFGADGLVPVAPVRVQPLFSR